MARKPIPGYAPYEADETGVIWRNGKPLAQRSNGHGYLRITASCNGALRHPYVHQLVALAFHGEPPAGHQCAHINGKRDDNRADNLRWATKAENEADKVTHGTRLRGSDMKHAVLTEDMVIYARRYVRRGGQIKDLADLWGINAATVGDAVRGDRWAHLSEPPVPRYTTRRKFTDDQIREIRAAREAGETIAAIARRSGVHHNAIWQIVTGKNYAHVSPHHQREAARSLELTTPAARRKA